MDSSEGTCLAQMRAKSMLFLHCNVISLLEDNNVQLKMSSVAVFGFGEIAKACASGSKVTCCDISSDGKLLATGGHDKKVPSSAQGSDLISPVVLGKKKKKTIHLDYSHHLLLLRAGCPVVYRAPAGA